MPDWCPGRLLACRIEPTGQTELHGELLASAEHILEELPLDIAIVRVVKAVGRFFLRPGGRDRVETDCRYRYWYQFEKPNKTGHKMARGPACCAEPLIWSVKTRFLYANRKSTSLENALTYQPACKPGSVGHHPLAQVVRDGHSSGAMFAHCLEQPTRTASLTSLPRRYRLKRTARVAVPIRSCSRCGLPCRFRCRTRGALLPHLFTLAAPSLDPSPACGGGWGGGSGSFSVALSLGLPPPDVIRHRMSMEPGLSSPATFR